MLLTYDWLISYSGRWVYDRVYLHIPTVKFVLLSKLPIRYSL